MTSSQQAGPATEYTDDHGIITLRTDGAEVDAVGVRGGWERHYDARTLSLAIRDLVRQAMPAATETPFTVTDRPILEPGPANPVALSAFWGAHAEYRAALMSIRERAGAIAPSERTDVSDDRRRVGVTYTGGRFEAIGLDPSWLRHASVQQISEVVTTVLRKQPLVRTAPLAGDIARAAELRRAVAMYRDEL